MFWPFTTKAVTSSSKNDDFASLSSHELRTPLSVIKWYTEMLLDGDAGPLTDDQKKYLTIIESSNQKAIDLVRSLLNVSRIDLGTFCIQPKATDITALIQGVITSLSGFAETNSVKINFQHKDTNPSYVLDEHIVTFLVKQIMRNAIQFSSPGKEVLVHFDEINGGVTEGGFLLPEKSLLITITDHGIGIPEESKGGIFTKMFKAKNVTDVMSSGSGLGLYMVKKLSLHFGGNIWFTSQENNGSTFFLSIPVSGMKPKEGRTTLD